MDKPTSYVVSPLKIANGTPAALRTQATNLQNQLTERPSGEFTYQQCLAFWQLIGGWVQENIRVCEGAIGSSGGAAIHETARG